MWRQLVHKFKFAFVLPELLLVILSGAVFLLLLLPMVFALDDDATRTGCRSHLRQIGMIMHAYAEDHAGEFPLWRARVSPLNNQFPFSTAIRHLASNDYVRETRIWVCPADTFDGNTNGTPVSPSTDIFSITNVGQVSYVFVAGHKLNGPESPATAAQLADESHFTENGAITPGNMPALGTNDNHGALMRNVLYLDSHIESLTGAAVNAIFDGFVDTQKLQAVD